MSVGPPLLFLTFVLAAAGLLAAMRGARRGAALALVAGLLYGLSDAATKGFTDAAGDGLLGAVLSPWPPVILALCAGAFFALQRGLQLGAAATVIVLMTAAMNVIAVSAGVAVFAESFGSPMGVARCTCSRCWRSPPRRGGWRPCRRGSGSGGRSADPLPRRHAAPLPAGAR